jgi:hypothetical protein
MKKTAFIRWFIVPACLLWGLMEIIALQRARRLNQQHLSH